MTTIYIDLAKIRKMKKIDSVAGRSHNVVIDTILQGWWDQSVFYYRRYIALNKAVQVVMESIETMDSPYWKGKIFGEAVKLITEATSNIDSDCVRGNELRKEFG